MRNLLTLTTLILSINLSYSQITKSEFIEIRKKLGTSIKSQSITYDKFDQFIWVNSGKIKLYPSGTAQMYYKILKKGDKIVRTTPRIKITYIGSNWVFINQATIAYSRLKDGDEELNTSTKIFDDDSDTHVFSGGNVRESIDALMSEDNIDFFEQLHKKKRYIQIKVEGDKRKAILSATAGQVVGSTELFFEKLNLYPNFRDVETEDNE